MAEPTSLEELTRENRALRQAVWLLHRIANLVRDSLELESTVYAVLTGVTAGVGLGLNRAMMFLADESETGMLRGVAAVGPHDAEEADRVWRAIETDAPSLEGLHRAGLQQKSAPSPLARHVCNTRIPIQGDSPIALAFRKAERVRGQGTDDIDGLLHLATAVCAPLRGGDSIRGVLYGDNRFTGQSLDPVAELVFGLVADHAGRALDSAREYERVAHSARTDALTGLAHHGSMKAALLAAMHAVGKQGTLGLAMVDLDDFKQVNDTHGHLAGDALLAGVAARLRAATRNGETPFRYGGEEFAVLLSGVTAEALLSVGERLRQAIAGRPFQVATDQSLVITCSVGLALHARSDADVDALIGAADQALLRAKANGKNRVELAR